MNEGHRSAKRHGGGDEIPGPSNVMKTIDHENHGPLFALMARLRSIASRDPEFAAVLIDSVCGATVVAEGATS